MAAELAARLARAFGVQVDTVHVDDDGEPEELFRAAEQLGRAIAERGGRARPAVEQPWHALPMRPDVAPAPRERTAATERLLAWARAAGASWDGIDLHIDGRGNASVRVDRKLAAGEPVLRVPRRLMIVDNELVRSSTGPVALGFREPRPRDALAAWLALEMREPASQWRAFLDALPVQLAELPMFRDPADLAALAGTAAHAIAVEQARDVRDTYDRLAPELRARLSLADFAWGCALVMSRAFHAPGTFEHRIAMVPIVDMFNHAIGDTTWTYDPLAGFVVITERPFAPGDELCFPYGDRSNTQLVVHYGFALPGNPIAEAGLVFDRAADPVNDVAAHLMWKLPLDAPARIRVACLLDDRFLRARSLARLQACGPAERARAVAAGFAPHGDMPWLGAVVEHAAFDVLVAAAGRGLAELDAPRAADRPWARTCAIVRDDERAVLAQLIEAISALREYLHWQDPARLRAAADAISEDATGAQCLVRQCLQSLADDLTA